MTREPPYLAKRSPPAQPGLADDADRRSRLTLATWVGEDSSRAGRGLVIPGGASTSPRDLL